MDNGNEGKGDMSEVVNINSRQVYEKGKAIMKGFRGEERQG